VAFGAAAEVADVDWWEEAADMKGSDLEKGSRLAVERCRENRFC
jgi:hypothetical protein